MIDQAIAAPLAAALTAKGYETLTAVQQAVLTELGGRKGLAVYSGIISDPVIGMLDADAATAALGAPDSGGLQGCHGPRGGWLGN